MLCGVLQTTHSVAKRQSTCFPVVVVECSIKDNVAIFISSAGTDVSSGHLGAPNMITIDGDFTSSPAYSNALPDDCDISGCWKPAIVPKLFSPNSSSLFASTFLMIGCLGTLICVFLEQYLGNGGSYGPKP